ncbi:hypothetical protein JCM10212_006510 [Sporobolomyces blumeae]
MPSNAPSGFTAVLACPALGPDGVLRNIVLEELGIAHESTLETSVWVAHPSQDQSATTSSSSSSSSSHSAFTLFFARDPSLLPFSFSPVSSLDPSSSPQTYACRFTVSKVSSSPSLEGSSTSTPSSSSSPPTTVVRPIVDSKVECFGIDETLTQARGGQGPVANGDGGAPRQFVDTRFCFVELRITRALLRAGAIRRYAQASLAVSSKDANTRLSRFESSTGRNGRIPIEDVVPSDETDLVARFRWHYATRPHLEQLGLAPSASLVSTTPPRATTSALSFARSTTGLLISLLTPAQLREFDLKMGAVANRSVAARRGPAAAAGEGREDDVKDADRGEGTSGP